MSQTRIGQVGVSIPAVELATDVRYLKLDGTNQSSWSPTTTLIAGLNADLLDGNHAAAFALSGHNHDVTYLKLDASNDPITGALTIQPATDTLTALVVNDKDGNNVLTVDTTNGRVGVGIDTPIDPLQVSGGTTRLYDGGSIGSVPLNIGGNFRFYRDEVPTIGAGHNQADGIANNSGSYILQARSNNESTWNNIVRLSYVGLGILSDLNLGRNFLYMTNGDANYTYKLHVSANQVFSLNADFTNSHPTFPTNIWNVYTDKNTASNRKMELNVPLYVTGVADVVQNIIKSNATQTANLTEWQNSSGTVLNSVLAGGQQYINVNQTNALVVEQDGVKDNVLVVDTTNGRVGIGVASPSFQVHASTGYGFGNYPSGIYGYISGGDWYTAGANFSIRTTTYNTLSLGTNNLTRLTIGQAGGVTINSASDLIQLTVKGNATQTANLTEWQNSSGTVLSLIDKNGIPSFYGGVSTTEVIIGTSAGNITHSGTENVLIGNLAGNGLTTGSNNVCVGRQAGRAVTEGNGNVCLGSGSGIKITTGSNNFAMGTNALSNITTQTYNVAIGYSTLLNASSSNSVAIGGEALAGGVGSIGIGSEAGNKSTGNYNVYLGYYSGRIQTTGSNNTHIGAYAGYGASQAARSRNIFIGYYAGYYQSGNDILMIGNQDYATLAAEQTNSIIYGVMAATPASQTLRINAELTISGDAIIGIADSNKAWFGAGKDMSIYYDGTDAYLKTSEVAASDFHLTTGTAKTLVLDTAVYDDLQFPIASGKVPAANFPTWETFTTNTSAYAFSVDDYIDLQADEPPHGWSEGTAGVVHVHFALKTAQSTGADRFAKFTCYVAIADVNGTWTEIGPYTAEATIATGSAALKHYLLDLGTATLTGYHLGAQLKARIKRIAATGGTEYADDVYITQVGIHILKTRIGSRSASAA